MERSTRREENLPLKYRARWSEMLRARYWVNPRGHLRQEWRETVYMRFLIKKVDYFAPGLRFPEHLPPPIPPWNAARLKASRPRLRSRIRRGRNENHRGQSRRADENQESQEIKKQKSNQQNPVAPVIMIGAAPLPWTNI